MADGFHRLIVEMRRHLPYLRAEGCKEWGASSTNFRTKIRTSLAAALSEQGEVDNVQDLTQVPRPKNWSVSISHAGKFGGWLALRRPQTIGFDCEEPHRVRPELIARMATSHEITEAPSAAALWCAKEATYKALEGKQPAVVSDIIILQWSPLSNDQYLFKPASHKACTGYVYLGKDLVFAACTVSP